MASLLTSFTLTHTMRSHAPHAMLLRLPYATLLPYSIYAIKSLPTYILHAFYVQMRSYAHKPMEARIILVALASTQCTHPKIAAMVQESGAICIGNGPSMFDDRLVEYINRIQTTRQKTSSSPHIHLSLIIAPLLTHSRFWAHRYAAFESALEYTPELTGMIHTTHALRAAEGTENPLDDELRQPILNAAESIREDLVRRLGTDLTVDDPTNPLYHTGGSPHARNTTNHKSLRPHDFIWRVARGQSAGEGRSKAESWEEYFDRFTREELWSQDS